MLTLKRTIGEAVVLREGSVEVRLTLADIGLHDTTVQLDVTEKLPPRTLPDGGSISFQIGHQSVQVVLYKRSGHAIQISISAPNSVHILREELQSHPN